MAEVIQKCKTVGKQWCIVKTAGRGVLVEIQQNDRICRESLIPGESVY